LKVRQHEEIDIPAPMRGRGDTFALRVIGTSMRDEGILPGDVIIVQKQATAERTDRRVLLDGEATVKKWYRKSHRIELHPANETMSLIIVRPDQNCRIEGIVTGVIRYCG
jgi:repressor LexA